MKIITQQQFLNTQRKTVIKNPILKALHDLETGYAIEVSQEEWNTKKWQKPYTVVREFGIRHDMKFIVKKVDDNYLILKTK